MVESFSHVRRQLVSSGQAGIRLDVFLAEVFLDVGRRGARLAIDDGRVFVDGRRCRVTGRRLPAGARILLHPAMERPTRDPPLVVFENEHCLAINKPAGWSVNATETAAETTIVEYFADRGAHVVHRLDRDTTGIMLLAKGPENAAFFSRAFAERRVSKRYWAVVEGPGVEGLLDGAIARDRRRPRARAVTSHGQSALTKVTLRGRADDWAWVEAEPVTGRTHQIRVHLAHAGCPILGDTLYGAVQAIRVDGAVVHLSRPLLHAVELQVPSVDGYGYVLSADAPADMLIYLERTLSAHL
ncbi:MAG: RluA family pseudouridine synthase [Myxococcales bacterium]|nr:RluA family pseudouridine synthase [Myxococcales bacterium]